MTFWKYLHTHTFRYSSYKHVVIALCDTFTTSWNIFHLNIFVQDNFIVLHCPLSRNFANRLHLIMNFQTARVIIVLIFFSPISFACKAHFFSFSLKSFWQVKQSHWKRSAHVPFVPINLSEFHVVRIAKHFIWDEKEKKEKTCDQRKFVARSIRILDVYWNTGHRNEMKWNETIQRKRTNIKTESSILISQQINDDVFIWYTFCVCLCVFHNVNVIVRTSTNFPL